MSIRTILVPCDFSKHSSAALDRAIELARSFGGRICLLHSYWVNLAIGAGTEPFSAPAEFIEKVRSAAGAELERIRKGVVEAGIDCEARLSAEPPIPAILDLARSLPADLIAMGTEGLTGMKHVLLGSVAERVVRLAPCPVLTVKAQPAS